MHCRKEAVSSKPKVLSELTFGSYLQYSPRGASETSRHSREWRDAVKFDRPGKIRQVVEHLKAHAPAGLMNFLSGNVLLVPAPRSSPVQSGALWPGLRICEELLAVGIGRQVVSCIQRIRAVQKSAFARAGERPTPEVHLNTLSVKKELVSSQRFIVVDDIVTKGATLLAAASVLAAAYPDGEIVAFALLRTRGIAPEVDRIVDPCVGRICLEQDGGAWRDP